MSIVHRKVELGVVASAGDASDFAARLAPAYAAEKWAWLMNPRERTRIPSASEIQETIEHLASAAQTHGCCESGGLCAERLRETITLFADWKLARHITERPADANT